MLLSFSSVLFLPDSGLTLCPPGLTGRPLKYHSTSGLGVPSARQCMSTGEPSATPPEPSDTSGVLQCETSMMMTVLVAFFPLVSFLTHLEKTGGVRTMTVVRRRKRRAPL